MAGTPPFAVQKKMMKMLSSRRLQTADWWEYAVAMSWVDSWQENAGGDSLPSDGAADASMDMSIVDELSRSTVKPVSMSDGDSENTYVPESQWRLYVSWFGVDGNYQFRRRPIYSGYMSLDSNPNMIMSSDVLFDRKLDFLPIWVGRLSAILDDRKQMLLRVFAWDSLDFISLQIRRVLGIGKNKNIRMWFNMKENSDDLCLDPITNGSVPLLNRICDVVPDVREVLIRRQVKVSPDYRRECHTDSDVRRPLEEEWYGERILSVTVLLEETGISINNDRTKDFQKMLSSVDEEFDSIVTLSSIRNEWDDTLTRYMEDYVDDMGAKSTKMKEELLDAARSIVGEKINEINEIRNDLEIRLRGVEEREASVKKREIEVTEQEKDIADKLSKYKIGLLDFQKRQLKLQEEMQRIESQNKIAETMVTLSVGGHVVTTSLVTLTKVEDSVLAQMFSGRHALHRQADGSFFIDRDGTNFRHILNYLRDGPRSVECVPDNTTIQQELIVEAEYYVLPELATLLRQKLQQLFLRAGSDSGSQSSLGVPITM